MKKRKLLAFVVSFALILAPFTNIAKAMTEVDEEQIEITLEKTENGSLYFIDEEDNKLEDEKLSFNKEDKVKLQVEANEGFELEKVESVKDEISQTLEVEENKLEITATENLTIKATFKEKEILKEEKVVVEEEVNIVKEEVKEVVEEPKIEQPKSVETKLLPTKQEEVKATTTIEQYLKSNVNSKYAVVKAFDVVGSMTIAPTMATSDTKSLDDLWANENIDKFINTSYSEVALYDIDKNSDYYVAYVKPDVSNATLVEYMSAKNNLNAEMRNDVLLENGIAYVPKKYNTNNDTRMQLLYATTEKSNAKTEVIVNDKNLVITSKIDSNIVQFNLDREVNYYNIKSLKINGKDETKNFALWAIDNSTFIINGTPASINKVEIELIESDEILIKASSPAWYTSPVHTLGGGAWEFGHEPQVGEVIKIFNTTNIYYGKVQTNMAYKWGVPHKWLQAGTLDNLTYLGLGQINADTNNLTTHYLQTLRSATIPAQTVGDIKIPNVPEFALVCSHVGVNANLDYAPGYNNSDKSRDKGVSVRIIAKHGNKLLAAIVAPTMNTQAGAGIYMINYTSGGEAQIQKSSVNNELKVLTDLCPLYTLNGAVYGIYTDIATTNKVAELTTDTTGLSNKVKLSSGTYYAKETKAPYGYQLSERVYEFTVTSGQVTTVNVVDPPILDPLSVIVKKTVENNYNIPVKDAEFEVKYYPVLGGNLGEATKTWTFKTDEKGIIRYKDNYKISGDELFKYRDVPLGLIGTYSIKETKAPLGLALDPKTVYIKIEPNGNTVKQTSSENKAFSNPIDLKRGEALYTIEEKAQKVNITLIKKDAETKEQKPQGYGSLEGAIYSVFKVVETGDEFIADITTDKFGLAGISDLLPSIYKIKEKQAPKGYLLNEEEILVDAKIQELNTAYFNYFAISEEIPTTTLVSKYFIDWDGNRQIVEGAVLQLLDGETVLEEWTSTKEPHVIKGLEDGKTYTIKEIKAPVGLEIAEPKTFTVKGKITNVEVEDKLTPPEIGTVAKDKHTGTQVLSMEDEAIDTISYKNLQPDTEYVIETKLFDVKADKLLDGTYEMKWRSPKAKAGEYSVSGEVKTEIKSKEKLEGKTIVFFEYFKKKDKVFVKHEDKKAKLQTLCSPNVTTKALSDKETHFIDGTKTEENINEKLFATDLVVGEEYEAKAKLAVIPTTEAAKSKKNLEYVQKDGKDYELTKTFIADKEEMVHDFKFTIDATKYASYKLVVVEELYSKGKLVARHAKLDNEDQTVRVSMILDVNIAKADADKVGYFLKGAEITIFNEDGTIAKDIDGNDAIGVTDENGKVRFSIPYSFDHKYYAKETKAPEGYTINDEKFEVKPTGEDKLGTDLIKIDILDEAIIIPPTGDNNYLPYAITALVLSALLGGAVLFIRRKK